MPLDSRLRGNDESYVIVIPPCRSAATTIITTTRIALGLDGGIKIFTLLRACIADGIDATVKRLGIVQRDRLIRLDTNDVIGIGTIGIGVEIEGLVTHSHTLAAKELVPVIVFDL